MTSQAGWASTFSTPALADTTEVAAQGITLRLLRQTMIEPSVLTLMTLAFMASRLRVRHRHPEAVAKLSWAIYIDRIRR